MKESIIPLIAVIIILTGITGLYPVKGASYTPAVKVGDYVDYGKIFFSSNNPSPFLPNEFNNTINVNDTVTSVNSTSGNVTLLQTYTFDNATAPRSVVLQGNLQTGVGNLTEFLIAGGLQAGDSVYSPTSMFGFSQMIINETVTRFYAGAVRTVNLVYFNGSIGGANINFAAYLDQQTGFLLELKFSNVQAPPAGPPEIFVLDLTATQTNLWSPATAGDYLLDALPLSSAFIYQGNSVNFALNLTRVNGFAGTTASLTASLSPSNSSVTKPPTISPPSPTVQFNGTSFVSVSASSNTITGLYLVDVNATSNGVDHSAILVVNVLPPDFGLTANPPSLNVIPGASNSTTITIQSLGGFSGPVNLANYTYQLATSLNSTNVILNPGGAVHVSLNVTAPSGAHQGPFYEVSIVATSAGITHFLYIAVTVNSGTGPDFSIEAIPGSMDLSPGTMQSSEIVISGLNGFFGRVFVTASYDAQHLRVVPAQYSATLTPNFPNSVAFFTLNVTAAPDAPPGEYPVLITATNGTTLVHTVTIDVNVTSISQSYFPGVLPGENATYRPVRVTWSSGSSLFPEFQFLKDLNNTDHVSVTVLSVSGSNTTLAYGIFFKNQTNVQGVFTVDVATGQVAPFPNGLSISPSILIAANLSAPEHLTGFGYSPTLNETSSRIILGVDRTVNFLNTTLSNPFEQVSNGEAWDQSSGIFLGSTFNGTFIAPDGGTARGFASLVMTDTNIWTPLLPPTVSISSVTPSIAETGTQITLNFTMSSSSQVSTILVNWGDGTFDIYPSTAQTALHTYISTGAGKSQTYTITVTAANAGGAGSDSTTATINDRPPMVEITGVTSPANTGQPVRLNFTAADPDGQISSITVDWGDGSTPDTLTNGQIFDTHTYNQGGTMKVNVTATDNGGSTRSTIYSLTVVAPPAVVINQVNPSPAVTGESVTVDFTMSSNGPTSEITVDWGDGTTDHLGPSQTRGTHIYLNTGASKSQTFMITVTAIDTAGPGSDSKSELVNDQPPTLQIMSIAPSPTNTTQTVTVNFAANDPDGSISIVTVNWGDGSPTEAVSSNLGTHVYSNIGDRQSKGFMITINATDNSGSSTVQSQTIIVKDLTPSVMVGTTSQTVSTGDTVSVTLSATDVDGSVTSITVDWGDGSNPTLLSGTATSTTHVYESTDGQDTKTVAINVTAIDNSGSLSSVTTTVTINDRSPTIGATSVMPNQSNTNSPFNLTLTANDPDGTISYISINWGDGTTDTLPGTATSASHTYTSPNTYTITVTAKDDSGNTHITTYTQTIVTRSNTILGLSPMLFYTSLGGIIAAIIVAGGVLALRRRTKSKE